MRIIDADYLKTWFGEKDLYTYDYIIGTIDDAPTVKPEAKLLAEIKIDKEDLEDLVAEKVEEIKETMSGKWIPCSERLPEKLGEYLVTVNTVGWNLEETTEIDIAYWDDLEGFHKAEKVIAWMPLPKPYEGEQE